MKPKISIRGLCQSFGSKVVLQDLDLDIHPGESMVIIGGSGTGKSVLIKLIVGLITPTRGQIWIDNHEVTALAPAKRQAILKKCGFLFQGGALFDSLPVWHNVAFGAISTQKMKKKEAQKLAVEKLEAVGLKADIASLYPEELSGGMRKRVALARAIATKPEIIFFDEPTTGLDPIMSSIIDDLIVSQVKNAGMTAVTITHDMGGVRKIADRVALLHNGRIQWIGDVKDLDKSGNAYVDQFIHGRLNGPITVPVKLH